MAVADEIVVSGSYDAIYEFCLQQGWTDGLPVVPPTRERVGAMLEWTDRDADEVVGSIPPLNGHASIRKIAANAVMAGCRPNYLPVVITAVEALLDKGFNLDAVQPTTGPITQLVIVNGPVARELGINAGTTAFGPGWRSNATIGRAIRLILVNIGGAKPGEVNQKTQGQPGMFSLCAAENEARSPWEPFHVEHGIPAEHSAVTVFATFPGYDIHEGETANDILTNLSRETGGMTRKLVNGGEHVVALCPEHAQILASAGFSKQQVKEFLWQHAGAPLAHLVPYFQRLARLRRANVFQVESGDDTWLPIADRPDQIHVIVVGGTSRHSTYFPCFSYSRFASRRITNHCGQAIRSVKDLFRNS
ncbi:MAG: hypothetical protein HYX87_05405 [Chloroflexi bacterium]|nr:hypothetical protein [Chloroflexota bacterium]